VKQLLLIALPVVLAAVALPAWTAEAPGPDARGDLQTVVRGNNEFALDLYGRLRGEEGNLFYSPYSISTALAMTYAGARGETAEQMARVLHFSLDQPRLHPAFAELTRTLNGHGLPRDYRLEVANSLWGDRGLRVRAEFQRLIKVDYGARVRTVDFVRDTEGARRQINRWVEERTNDKIKDLLHKDDVDGRTRLVLVNAIYFKGSWETPFRPERTEKDVAFEVAAGKTVPVPMMRHEGEFNYFENDALQMVELPYEGKELSMLVLLPRRKDGLADLEGSLTADRLGGWLRGLASREVNLGLPRFKMSGRFELAKTLIEMGMPLAFSGAADFSGMSDYEKLFISKIIHQAFVDVNEEGTEAAAASAVVMAKEAEPAEPVTFRADHPFLFLLRDTRTGSILFLGRLSNPGGGG
jgi:serpin B